MGLLDKLWDEILAGPQPESGLSRLRKHASFGGSLLSSMSTTTSKERRVSRAITIMKTANFSNLTVEPSSSPSSPPVSAASESPLSWSPSGELKKFSIESTSDAYERAEPRSPTVYDWVVISALDR